MKKNCLRKYIFPILLIGLGLFSSNQTLKVSAGSMTNVIVDNNTFVTGEFDKSEWKISNGIEIADSKVTFNDEAFSFEDVKLLSLKNIFLDDEFSDLEIGCQIKIDSLENKRVGIGFGFQKSKYLVGNPNTNFIYVAKDTTGYYLGGEAYDTAGVKTDLASSRINLTGSSFNVRFKVDGLGNIKVYSNNIEVISSKIESNLLSGYFCFLEEGYTTDTDYAKWVLSNVSAINHYYSRPTNVNINDNFNDNDLDASVWYVSNNGPYLKGVAAADGGLKYFDCGGSVCTTRYEYSNFELHYDITDMQRIAEYNQDGTLKRPANQWFGFFCGLDCSGCYDIDRTDTALLYYRGYFLSFKPSLDQTGNSSGGVSILFGSLDDQRDDDKSRKSYKLPDNYDIYNPMFEDKDLNVVFTAIDGTYTFDIKWSDEDTYYNVFTVKGEAYTGYISLVSYGSGRVADASTANFTLDNIQIINRDLNGNVISVDKKSSNFIKVGDYKYTDTKSDVQLIKDGTDFDEIISDRKGCKNAVIPSLGGLLACLIGLLSFKRREK